MSPRTSSHPILGWTDPAPSSRAFLISPGDGSLLTVAPPGGGKSRCVAIPNLIHYDGSMVVNDIKGELTVATALWRFHMLNQKVLVFDPFRVVDLKFIPKRVDGEPSYGAIDIIAFVKRSRSPLSAAYKIAEAMIVSEGTKEPHWPEGAQNLFVALILFIAFEVPAECQTLSQVWKVFTDPVQFASVLEMMLDSEITHVRDQAGAFLDVSKDDREMKSIKNNFRTQCTRTFSEPSIMTALSSPDTVDFSRINHERMTVYIVIPGDLIEVHFRFVRLIMNVILSEIERGGLRSHE